MRALSKLAYEFSLFLTPVLYVSIFFLPLFHWSLHNLIYRVCIHRSRITTLTHENKAHTMPVSDTPNDVKVVRIRRCNDSADADAIHSLVKELAEFERMPDGVLLSADDIRRDGFNTSHPLFFAALAEERVEDGWSAVGFLLCYYKYSTWYVPPPPHRVSTPC